MFRKRHSQSVPQLNTTSTADISFMLLIFFLVTSSMDTDKGLLRQLPPPPVEEVKPMEVQQEHVFSVNLDAQGQLSCEGALLTHEQLEEKMRSFIANDRTEHVVSLSVDRDATYEDYFRLQNTIVSVYHSLRDAEARRKYHCSYAALSSSQRDAVNQFIPQRISEQEQQR
ncbi:MAG: biopolymer transporter ExbD [Prevotella sp.]|nr:biopolymer transporter ExbD [Prevotella sp.]